MSTEQQSSLRELPARLYNHLSTLLGGSPPHPEGYVPIPTYGSTNGAQTLPSDGTKIEPKVWLASERTFLNWLRVSLLISSFALALFNAAGEGDWVAKGMGMSYCGIAVGMLGYAWTMQERRRTRIMSRFPGHHDDLYGPIIVCTVIFLAVLVNFILRVNQRERLRDHPTPKNPWVYSIDLIQSAFVMS